MNIYKKKRELKDGKNIQTRLQKKEREKKRNCAHTYINIYIYKHTIRLPLAAAVYLVFLHKASVLVLRVSFWFDSVSAEVYPSGGLYTKPFSPSLAYILYILLLLRLLFYISISILFPFSFPFVVPLSYNTFVGFYYPAWVGHLDG